MPTIKDALDIIGKLTVAEQESLKTMLLSPAFVKSLNIEDFVAKERFANGRVCPLCGCIHVVRNGHRKDGTQRYVCKDCGKSFVIATNSIVSGTRKDLSVWEQYIDCMMNGLSIRKTAVACGIHRNTAFLWRHKILDALQNMADDVTLDGIIEADETFFAISYKGNHARVRHLLCHARLISVVILHISEACPKKRYVFLVRLIGMACLSPRLRILVEFLQEIYIIFMMVGLRPIPLLLRTR